MTAYNKLWEEIDGRLRVAFSIVQIDDPMAANIIDAPFHEWLDHNELELALDELIVGADRATNILRRRYWEELLIAAILMKLERQFHHLISQIDGLEPYLFDVQEKPPHIYCDFNGMIETDLYSLDSVATALDFARLGYLPKPDELIILYDHDIDDDGTPSWMLADAQLIEYEPWGLAAKVTPQSYRWKPRQL